MKLCVLGNSHAGSLRQGWELMRANFSSHTLVFFAARASMLQGLHLKNKSLVPKSKPLEKSISYTSGGMVEIDLSSYDGFLIYGLGLRAPVLRNHFSNAVVRETCKSVLSKAISVSLAEMIRSATDRPVWIGGNPQKSWRQTSFEMEGNLGYKQVAGFLKSSLSVSNSTLVFQPDETLHDNGWNTKQEYSIGSRRLDVGDNISNIPHPEDDDSHMNSKFGEFWLKSFFQTQL